MSFRRATSLSISIVFFVSGCGLHTGESAPKKNPPSYSGQGFACVGRIPEHVDKYVNDQLSEAEIGVFVSCLQKAFVTFASLTRGRNATSYSPDEIRRFLHEFFLGDRRISDALMGEMMVLKQTMVGGSLEAITREELHVAVEVLEEIKVSAVKLKPHLKVLNPRLARLQDPSTLGKRLVDANEALNSVIQTVAARLQKNQRNYALSNVQNLLIEFRAFVGWEKHFPQAIEPEKWVNFLRIFRQLTVAPSDSTVIRPIDWAPMLQSFTRWYLVFLQYEIGVKDQPVLSGVGLQNTIQLGQEVFTYLEQCAARQEGLTIRFEQMDEMTRALADLRWLPSGIRPESVQQAIQASVNRILGDPEIAPSQRASEGLSLASIARARDMFFRWAYIQMNLDTRLAGTLQSQKVVPNVQIRPYLTPDVRSKLKNLRSSEWDDFLKLRSSMRPLFPEDSFRVYLVRNEELGRYNLRHSFNNLTMMNLWRSAASLIFRGYAEQAGSRVGWESGITQKELEQFYADFREIGIDLKLVDARNPNMGGRDFISANLFTYSGDGLAPDPRSTLGRMRMVEAMELFSFLFSGGRLSEEIYQEVARICPNGPPDPYGRPTVARACVQENLTGVLDRLLVNMPDLQQFLKIAPLNVRQAYARTLLETSFSPRFSKVEWVELNELITAAVILHYAEAVMTRFDTNRDGLLNNEEIDHAADIFMGFIKKFAKEKLNKDLSDRQAKGAFHYILTYREVPSGFWDIAWLSYISSGTLSLNRADLSTVFRVIIAKLFDTGKKPEPPPPPEPSVMPCNGMDLIIPESCWFHSFGPKNP